MNGRVQTDNRGRTRRSPRPKARLDARASVPLALGEAAEGDQPDKRHDEADPEAPHDHENDPHDDQDAAQTDPARVSARSTACRHVLTSSARLTDSAPNRRTRGSDRADP